MRQMPAGQWVAFENDAAHDCAAPPKASPARKPPRRHPPPPAPSTDDEFGTFVLPNDNAVTGKKAAIAKFVIAKPPSPSQPVQPSGPNPQIRLPVNSPIAVGRLDAAPSRPPLPQAEPVRPVPAASSQGFRQSLTGFLVFILVVGLFKVMLRESAHPDFSKTNATTIRSDARPNLSGQTSSLPSTLETRPIDADQSASAPTTPLTPAAAKKAADAAVIACIEQYASQDLKSGGDYMLGVYKTTACEDHVRRIYPGTRGDPAPGEPYPYPPIDIRRR